MTKKNKKETTNVVEKIVDTVEATLDSYDVEDFCKLWNKGEIVDTHRNHYQYKIYTDINKARSLLKFYEQKTNVPNIIEAIESMSASREEKDKAIDKLKEMYYV